MEHPSRASRRQQSVGGRSCGAPPRSAPVLRPALTSGPGWESPSVPGRAPKSITPRRCGGRAGMRQTQAPLGPTSAPSACDQGRARLQKRFV